jgi:hypothetical protein
MAIEIKELVIRAVVDYPASGNEKGQASAREQADYEERDESAIIDACVKQVLKIIERKQKR